MKKKNISLIFLFFCFFSISKCYFIEASLTSLSLLSVALDFSTSSLPTWPALKVSAPRPETGVQDRSGAFQ